MISLIYVKKQDGDKIEVSLEDLQNFIEGVVEAELDEIDILEYARA